MQASSTIYQRSMLLQPPPVQLRACQRCRCVEVQAQAKGFGSIAKKGFGLVKQKEEFWG